MLSCYNCANEKNVYMFFKSSVGFVLSNYLNAKKIHLKCEIHNTASVFNTTYTIQCRVNCPNIFIVVTTAVYV